MICNRYNLAPLLPRDFHRVGELKVKQFKNGNVIINQYSADGQKHNPCSRAIFIAWEVEKRKRFQIEIIGLSHDAFERLRGNILSIKRKGYVYDDYHNINHGFIDDLSLTYNGNQLKSINDDAIQSNVITTNDFLDKRDNNYLTEYLYDKNGNQYADLNKGIAWIKYNLLNLPEKIQFRNGTKNEYIYDASGIKRRANYNYSTNTTLIPLGQTSSGNNAASTYRLDYCDNYVYEKSGGLNPKLKRIITPEGFIQTYQGLLTYLGYWKYLYNLKDHQGNTRFVLSSDYISNSNSTNYTSTEQIDYYPFGLERSNTGQTSGGPLNSGTNPYLYNGKEIDRMHGLYSYDYGARWRDGAIPGWRTPDPLAEKYYSISPYVYCANNPVNMVDPDGKEVILVIWTTGTEGNGVGHAGIAVSNYKKEKYTEYDAYGVARENSRLVADGTYTFYDNWPVGDGVNFNLKGALTSVDAYRNVSKISSFDEFTNGSTVSPSETNAPNAVLKLSTSYEQDMAISGRLLYANQEKKEYNGAWYNCSSYVSDGLKAIFGKTVGEESMLGPIKSVTPNQLWKDTQTNAEMNNIPCLILKDPGSEADNKFRATIKGGN